MTGWHALAIAGWHALRHQRRGTRPETTPFAGAQGRATRRLKGRATRRLDGRVTFAGGCLTRGFWPPAMAAQAAVVAVAAMGRFLLAEVAQDLPLAALRALCESDHSIEFRYFHRLAAPVGLEIDLQGVEIEVAADHPDRPAAERRNVGKCLRLFNSRRA